MSSVELYVGAVNYTGTETMTWRIHEYDFFANALNEYQRGPLVATLSTPSTLTANAVNVFTAPSGTILKPNTRYLLNLHRTGDAADDAQIGVIQDNGESGLSDWRIEDAFRLLGGLYGPGFSIRFSMKGTVRDPFTASLGSAEFSIDEHAGYYGGIGYHFDLTLTDRVAIAARKLRQAGFSVTNGIIVRAARIDKEVRVEGGRRRVYSNHWRLTALPVNDREAVTVQLRGSRPCTEAGALCGAVGNRVTNSPELTLHYPDLTMDTDNLPTVAIRNTTSAENNPYMAFKVRLSERARQIIEVDFATVAGGTATPITDYLPANGGVRFMPGERVKEARVRLVEDSVNDAGETVFAQIGNARVRTLSGLSFPVPTITTAQATGTINAPASTTQIANLTIRIDNDWAYESDGWLIFPVTLSRAYSKDVCYDFETLDTGSATAGVDYGERPKVLQTIRAGKTEETSFVRIYDDSVNDPNETVKVQISNARLCTDGSKTVRIGLAQATGTIWNTDPIPQAWLARFGRTVADQVLDAVEGRMTAPRAPGVEASLAGQPIGAGATAAQDLEAREAEAKLEALAGWLRGEADEESAAGLDSRAVTERDLLVGSSFSFTGGTARTGTYALWGRGAVTRFDGREGGLSLDGEVTSGMFGADWTRDALTAGLVVSHSLGEGGYREEGDGGRIAASLTGLYPWAAMRWASGSRSGAWRAMARARLS